MTAENHGRKDWQSGLDCDGEGTPLEGMDGPILESGSFGIDEDRMPARDHFGRVGIDLAMHCCTGLPVDLDDSDGAQSSPEYRYAEQLLLGEESDWDRNRLELGGYIESRLVVGDDDVGSAGFDVVDALDGEGDTGDGKDGLAPEVDDALNQKLFAVMISRICE